MLYPVYITFKSTDGVEEASASRFGPNNEIVVNGKWRIISVLPRLSSYKLYTGCVIAVDDMPQHWIEQLHELAGRA